MNFQRQGFQKLSSDIHTDKQTDRQTQPKLYIGTTLLRGWSVIIINKNVVIYILHGENILTYCSVMDGVHRDV